MSIDVVAMAKETIELFESYVAEFREYFGSDVVHNLY